MPVREERARIPPRRRGSYCVTWWQEFIASVPDALSDPRFWTYGVLGGFVILLIQSGARRVLRTLAPPLSGWVRRYQEAERLKREKLVSSMLEDPLLVSLHSFEALNSFLRLVTFMVIYFGLITFSNPSKLGPDTPAIARAILNVAVLLTMVLTVWRIQQTYGRWADLSRAIEEHNKRYLATKATKDVEDSGDGEH